jgi:hypothetical protein
MKAAISNGPGIPKICKLRPDFTCIFPIWQPRYFGGGVAELKTWIVIGATDREEKMDSSKKRSPPDRSKINIHDPQEVKCWTKELGVNRDQLERLVDKVGNSAAAVRKELAT